MRDVFWIVINPDGSYAGAPCYSAEEARELAIQREGRRIFILDSGSEVTIENLYL